MNGTALNALSKLHSSGSPGAKQLNLPKSPTLNRVAGEAVVCDDYLLIINQLTTNFINPGYSIAIL